MLSDSFMRFFANIISIIIVVVATKPQTIDPVRQSSSSGLWWRLAFGQSVSSFIAFHVQSITESMGMDSG
uniref:Putative secreted protein n=1 Tax=Anopheles darlingi TaxID=43151 RepID=A0A2M4D2U8_ANODA